MYSSITLRPTILDIQYASRDTLEALPFTSEDDHSYILEVLDETVSREMEMG